MIKGVPDKNKYDTVTDNGISLLDCFAAKAMNALIVGIGEILPGSHIRHNKIAKESYKIAKAMMNQRND